MSWFVFSFSGDGKVNFKEFFGLLADKTKLIAESFAEQEELELRDAFHVFDKNNRGYITASDLHLILKCLGEDLNDEESMWKH